VGVLCVCARVCLRARAWLKQGSAAISPMSEAVTSIPMPCSGACIERRKTRGLESAEMARKGGVSKRNHQGMESAGICSWISARRWCCDPVHPVRLGSIRRAWAVADFIGGVCGAAEVCFL
jgi:hypothetical protein